MSNTLTSINTVEVFREPNGRKDFDFAELKWQGGWNGWAKLFAGIRTGDQVRVTITVEKEG